MGEVAKQLLNLQLPGQIARPVPGLLEVELLLSPVGSPVLKQPAARRVDVSKAKRLLDVQLAAVNLEAGEASRRSVRDQDVDELARPGPVSKQARAGQDLLGRRRQSLGA